MRNQQFGLSVVVNGQPLPVIEHGGKHYIAAPWNADYKLRLHLPDYSRYLAVISVDGLDILTGKAASVNSGGYVARGPTFHDEHDIPGFRLNDREVAAFHFGDRADSYAAQMDKPANVGVISAVIYMDANRGMELQSFARPVRRGAAATRGGGGHDMGTEFGSRVEHRVSSTTFSRGREVARIVIEYASKESLAKAGILVEAPLGAVEPFPADRGYACVPPRNWRG